MQTCSIADSIQRHTSSNWNQLWFLPDIVIAAGLITLFANRKQLLKRQVLNGICVWVALFAIRWMVEKANPCSMPQTHPGRDSRHFLLTGHLITAAIIAWILATSPAIPRSVVAFATLLAITIGPISILTREHYTRDVVVTWLILLGLLFAFRLRKS